MKSIILLSGPVGAGKTTVSHDLVALSPSPLVCIEGDKFWPFIVKPGAKPAANFKMSMTAMVAAALSYALYGYEVIVDFSAPPWFLETAQKITRPRNVPIDYVVLLPGLSTCQTRAAERREGAVKNYTRYLELYEELAGAGDHIIRTDGLSPLETAQCIRRGVDCGEFRLTE